MSSANKSTLFAVEQMRQINFTSAQHYERVSSSLRINRGADDPSGLAITAGMKARIRGMHVALQNLQDTHNMLSTADRVVSQTWQTVFRMRDLTVRAANEATLTTDDRLRIQDEINKLRDELSRQPTVTTFNTKHILSPEGAPSTHNFPSIENGNLTVTENTVLAGTEFYENLKTRMINMIPGALEIVHGMLGIPAGDTLQIQLHFEDPIFANPFESIRVSTPNANTIMFKINLGFFTIQPPLTFPIFGTGDESAMPPEMAFVYNMAQGVTALTGVNLTSVSDKWAIVGYSIYQARGIDRIIEWNPAAVTAAVAGSLTSSPFSPINPLTGTGFQQYAETGLAFQYISENYGNDKIREILQYAADGDNFQNAVLKSLPDFASFNNFEAAVDAWSLDYINNGRWNNITNALGRTLSHPRTDSPQKLTNSHIGPAPTSKLQISLPWVTGGVLDYLAMIDVRDTESAHRSLETFNPALAHLADIQAKIGITEKRIFHIINDVSNEQINQIAAKSRIEDADIAQETIEMIKTAIKSQTNKIAIMNSDLFERNTLSLLTMQ
ncbi:MAG: flagellin [bacterium]